MAEFNQEAFDVALDRWNAMYDRNPGMSELIHLYLEEVGKLESEDEFRQFLADEINKCLNRSDFSGRAVADRAIELVREHDKGKQ